MAALSTNLFDSLPIETNQHIASFLEYDQDVCNFRLICQSTLDAVDADNCSFWRRRFVSCFEDPGWSQSNNEKYKSAYQIRRSVLKNGAQFKLGETRRETVCLELLRELVVESFAGKPIDNSLTYESFNLEHIKRFLLANDILQIIFKRIGSRNNDKKPTPLLTTIQIVCAPMLLSFEPHLESYQFCFPESQAAVYSTATQKPVFGGAHGLDVNMEFILHNINFWKYHMIREVEGTLFYAFSELDFSERPRWWSTKLTQNDSQKLGKRWKGSYAYIERPELEKLRSQKANEHSDQIQDYFAGEETASFQDMHLVLVDSSNPSEFPWPIKFERHLRSLTPPPSHAKTRAQKRSATPDAIANFKPQSFRFDGEGQDVAEAFLASGWLNPLPPQDGIPGWQRMTMMKYFEDENDPDGIDVNALWAYEGVVLPGGQIMLGRWWSPEEDDEGGEFYSGPFILWCVDGPEWDADDEEMEKEQKEKSGGEGRWNAADV